MKKLLALLLMLSMVVGMIATASAVVITEDEDESVGEKLMFNSCDTKDGYGWWGTSGNPTVDPTELTQGNASIVLSYEKYSGKPGDIQMAFSTVEPVDASHVSILSFNLWVGTEQEAQAMGEAKFWFELTSSGVCDKQENSAIFLLDDLVKGGKLKKGWNTVEISLSNLWPAGGTDHVPMDAASCNFFRMFNFEDFPYLSGNKLTFRVDNFHFYSKTLSDDQYVSDCDTTKGWSVPAGITLTEDNDVKTQGAASVSAFFADVNGTGKIRIQYQSTSGIDISEKKNVEFDMWIGDGVDINAVNNAKFCFELSSSGNPDHQELNVTKTFPELTGKALVEGWNHVVIPISSFVGKCSDCGPSCAHAYKGEFDATRWNFFRIFNAGDLGSGFTIKIDAFTLTSDGGAEANSDLYTFRVGGDDEKSYLYETASENAACRYADGERFFTYKYTLKQAVGDATKLEWRGLLYQQYLLSVSTDGVNYVKVAAYAGPEAPASGISNAPSSPICIDLLPYVEKDTTEIYVRIGDVYPANGWGGALPKNSEVVLEVSYAATEVVPAESVKLMGVDILDKVYDGKPVELTGVLKCQDMNGNEIPVSDADLVYTWSVYDGDTIEGAPADAGTYLLVISMKDPAYKGQIKIKFTIEKAPMTIKVKDQEVTLTTSGETIKHTFDVSGVNIKVANAIKQGKYEFATKPVEGKTGEFTVELKAMDRAGLTKEYSNYAITFEAGSLKVTCTEGAHTFGEDWETDGTNHWHACVWCGEKSEVAAHKYSAACDEDCDICGATRAVTHTYSEDWKTDGTNHWHECSVCGGKKDISVHIFSNACAENCNICGYKRTITHEYKVTWSYDETNHWHMCKNCGVKKDEAAHTWNEGQVKKPATVNAEGVMQYTCTVCGHTKTAAIAKLDPITVSISDKSWKKGDLTIQTTVSEKTLTGVSVDGTVIGPENYTIVEGNVVLSESYLKTLAKGEHTVSVASTANTESDTFTVAGGSMNLTLIIIIAAAVVVVAVVVVIVIVVSKKKKKA